MFVGRVRRKSKVARRGTLVEGVRRKNRVARRGMLDDTTRIGDDARKVTIGSVSENAVIAERNSAQQKQDNRGLTLGLCQVPKIRSHGHTVLRLGEPRSSTGEGAGVW